MRELGRIAYFNTKFREIYQIRIFHSQKRIISDYSNIEKINNKFTNTRGNSSMCAIDNTHRIVVQSLIVEMQILVYYITTNKEDYNISSIHNYHFNIVEENISITYKKDVQKN